MAKYQSEQLRNVGLMGHNGAGKTSLGESILFVSGKTDRLGSVNDGNTVFDSEPEEVSRHLSISTSIAYCEWLKHKLNILDTPGEMNFFADSRNAVPAMDMVIIVIDGVDGIKVQSEKAWDLANKCKIPVLIFVNKLEKERAKFDEIKNEIVESFEGINPLFLQYPIGSETEFKGLVDILETSAHTVKDDKGNYDKGDVPEAAKDAVAEMREQAVEKIAEVNDTYLEKYLEEGELNKDEISNGLKLGFKDRKFSPILIGAAHKLIGVRELLDFLVNNGPCPLEIGTIKGFHPDTKQELEFKTSNDAQFSGLIFKTIVDQFAGRLNLVRVFSGKTTSDATLLNTTKGLKEKIANVYTLSGKKTETISEIITGDIIAIAKLKGSFTGDTFASDEKNAIVLPFFEPLPGLISYAVKPKSKGDEDKIANALNRILEEDPAVSLSRDEVNKSMILTGMGLVHLEAIAEKIKRKFGVDLLFEAPQVPYRETMKGKVQVQGRYKKQSGGRGQFGDTWIRMEPSERGKGFDFVDKIVGGSIPKNYIPAVERGIYEAMQLGVVAGYPVTDIRVELFDGSYHDVDSSEMAFKIAGSMGFKKGFSMPEAKPTILEPIYNMEVTIPEEYMGDIMGDITSRRGRVCGMDAKGKNQIIKAQAPLAEILTYINDLTSMTSGKGSYTMEYSHYEEVPGQIAEKLKTKYEESRNEE